MKKCVVNTLKEQVTPDADIAPTSRNLTGLALATTFVLKAKAKERCMQEMIAIEKAMQMAPYFNRYIMEAEIALGKPREQFTEEEKERCTNEFTEIYNGATKILDTFSI